MPKILVLTANSTLKPLKVANELRQIKRALEASSNFVVVDQVETRPEDLVRLLRVEKPEIVHFAGHGLNGLETSLSLTGDNGNHVVLSFKDLGVIFGAVRARPKLLFLNACHSAELTAELEPHVDVIIGAKGAINDDAAQAFAAYVYSALGQSIPVGKAFELARVQLETAGFDSSHLKLVEKRRVKANNIIFYARPQLLAKFRGSPVRARDKHYNIDLFVRGAEHNVEEMAFELCHDSFDEPYWTTKRSESNVFYADDFRTTGDLTIRIMSWPRGIGDSVCLSEALTRHYGPNSTPRIRKAIDDIKNS